MAPQTGTVWYVAYGSNMSSTKFTGSRGIVPIATSRVRIPGFELAMETPGVPYSEPSFASITPRKRADLEQGTHQPDVIGVAYLLQAQQYERVIASEGGGIAYKDIEVQCEPLGADDRWKLGERVQMRTLGTILMRRPAPTPSQRYMSILTDGAQEAELPGSYQKYLVEQPVYKPPSSLRTKLGAYIFLAIWVPVMTVMEILTKKSIQSDGNAHWAVVILVRWIVFIMWDVFHDGIFAPIFGRGDGLGA